jgi:uncharacterized protein YbjT (DUF2867 family)
MKTALIIGATGVTGAPLLKELLEDNQYGKVIAFTRSKISYEHAKLVNELVDFDLVEEWAARLQGDDLFSAMGTTLKQAGSKEAQYKVDYHYQAKVAKRASDNGVSRLFLVSSPNAKASSPIFYSRIKGELEDYVAALNFKNVIYFRPSLIVGDRPDNRIGEKVGISAMNVVTKFPFMSKFRSIEGAELAQAIANSSKIIYEQGLHSYEFAEIFALI